MSIKEKSIKRGGWLFFYIFIFIPLSIILLLIYASLLSLIFVIALLIEFYLLACTRKKFAVKYTLGFLLFTSVTNTIISLITHEFSLLGSWIGFFIWYHYFTTAKRVKSIYIE